MAVEDQVFVYGAGGHAKVVIDILELQKYKIAVILDDNVKRRGQTLMGYMIEHTIDVIDTLKDRGITRGVIAIGDNRLREMQAECMLSKGYSLIAAVHPSAIVSKHASIRKGTVIAAGVVVNPYADIGDFSILNTGCTVDHDCKLGTAVHVAPGAHIGGTVTVGTRSLIGTGAAVLHNCKIGRETIVGAGAAVIGDLPNQVTAVGVPAKVIKD